MSALNEVALPSGRCTPASVRLKAHRLRTRIPRGTPRWKALYRRRAATEREFGRLKHEYGPLPLRVRGLERIRLHADLCILARLASARASMRVARTVC